VYADGWIFMGYGFFQVVFSVAFFRSRVWAVNMNAEYYDQDILASSRRPVPCNCVYLQWCLSTASPFVRSQVSGVSPALSFPSVRFSVLVHEGDASM
jgi:hypothetical protein